MHSFILNEKRKHGTLEFPVAYYDIIPTHPHYLMPYHWHKEWELIRIRSGKVNIHAENDVFSARKGDILLLHEGMLHGSDFPENVLYDCLVFDLRELFHSSKIFNEQLRSLYHMKILPDVYFPRETNSDIYPFVSELMDIHFQHEHSPQDTNYLELATVSNLCHMFLRILQNGHYSTTANTTDHFTHQISHIKSVLNYIENNYTSEITLDDLAHIGNINPRYLCQIFKQFTSLSPMNYLNYFRIEQACILLSTTTLPIIDIALQCGFNDCSYFTRVFKRTKDMTPTQYRKLS